jgi:EAL domain-containing protein (putative c-di-GMP-specific phosphodiesterase class I)
VVKLDSLEAIGYEALTVDYLKYCAGCQSVDAMFELDLKCLAAALSSLSCLPEKGLLFLNITPAAFCDTASTSKVLAGARLSRIILEVTETATAAEVCCLQMARAGEYWREFGIKGVAVDDVSAGYNRIRFIRDLHPLFIKLDHPLVEHCHLSERCKAVVASLAALAHNLGAQVIAEGVEHEGQRQALLDLKVPYAQGHYLGSYTYTTKIQEVS